MSRWSMSSKTTLNGMNLLIPSAGVMDLTRKVAQSFTHSRVLLLVMEEPLLITAENDMVKHWLSLKNHKRIELKSISMRTRRKWEKRKMVTPSEKKLKIILRNWRRKKLLNWSTTLIMNKSTRVVFLSIWEELMF